jgi:hypothetical protein
MILLSPTAYRKQIRQTGQAWNLSQVDGKLKDMENYHPVHIVKNEEERNKITVEEIKQALAKGTGYEEVGVDRTQGPVYQENQRLTQTLSELSPHHNTREQNYESTTAEQRAKSTCVNSWFIVLDPLQLIPYH